MRPLGVLLLLSALGMGDVRIITDAQGRKIIINSRTAIPQGLPSVVPRRATPEVRDAAVWSHIYDAARTYGLDPELVAAVIKVESGFNPLAVSRKGAQGLMQLMPGTARLLGLDDAFDGRSNIFGGCRYLKSLIDDFEGNLRLALAAYNAGKDTVLRYNGIPPYPETRNYVQLVMRLYRGEEGLNFPGPRRVRLLRDGSGRVLVTNQRR